MTEVVEAAPGLRERKKQRTRATLIDAAIELCMRQGFERTTVDQIAAIADVSPRTFNRYFATKNAVVLAFVGDLVEMIAEELRRQPADISDMDAVYRAHLGMYHRSKNARPSELTADRLLVMVRIIMTSPQLRNSLTEYRAEPIELALAQRMGVGPDDPQVRLIGAVWGSIIMTALAELLPTTERFSVTIDEIIVQLEQTYRDFVAVIADVRQPV